MTWSSVKRHVRDYLATDWQAKSLDVMTSNNNDIFPASRWDYLAECFYGRQCANVIDFDKRHFPN